MEKNRIRPITNGKSSRMSYSRQKEVLEMPNLIEVQKNSYEWFLDEGLKEVLDDISPIADYSGHLSLESVSYTHLDVYKRQTEGCAFGSMKLVDESTANSQPIVIEYANKDLKRSIFDTYSFDPGDAYYLGEDGFYYTTEEVSADAVSYTHLLCR